MGKRAHTLDSLHAFKVKFCPISKGQEEELERLKCDATTQIFPQKVGWEIKMKFELCERGKKARTVSKCTGLEKNKEINRPRCSRGTGKKTSFSLRKLWLRCYKLIELLVFLLHAGKCFQTFSFKRSGVLFSRARWGKKVWIVIYVAGDKSSQTWYAKNKKDKKHGKWMCVISHWFYYCLFFSVSLHALLIVGVVRISKIDFFFLNHFIIFGESGMWSIQATASVFSTRSSTREGSPPELQDEDKDDNEIICKTTLLGNQWVEWEFRLEDQKTKSSFSPKQRTYNRSCLE